jgi:hypothetical protein
VTSQTDQQKPKPHWREVKLRRVALLFVIIVGGLAALKEAADFAIWFIQPYLIDGKFGLDKPFLESVRTPLKETGTATLTGVRIEEYGCSFQVPWNSIEMQYGSGSVTIVRFSGRAGLMLKGPEDSVGSFPDIAKEGPKEHASMAALFGEDAIRSNYHMVRAALYARPSDVRWWNSRRAHIRLFELLVQKDMLLMSSFPTAHPLATAFVRGFQFDDTNDRGTHLLLFDAKDRQYEIDLIDHGSLTQPQINAIVASFQPRP